MKKFHDALKTIYDPKRSGATTLLSADGSTLLTDREAILKRWAEHFNSVLNRPSRINEDAIDRLTQYPRKQPTATFVRHSRPSLGTYKILG